MRVFFAFDLDEALLDGASALMDVLRGRVAGKWCARQTLHVTARFVGEVDDLQVLPLAEIVFRLTSARRGSPIARASRLGGFPDDRAARVVYAAVEDDGTMAAMAQETDFAVTALGALHGNAYPREERAYIPHLTLARTKSPIDVTALNVPVALEGRATAFTLYRSVGGAGGAKYEPIARRSLDT